VLSGEENEMKNMRRVQDLFLDLFINEYECHHKLYEKFDMLSSHPQLDFEYYPIIEDRSVITFYSEETGFEKDGSPTIYES